MSEDLSARVVAQNEIIVQMHRKTLNRSSLIKYCTALNTFEDVTFSEAKQIVPN